MKIDEKRQKLFITIEDSIEQFQKSKLNYIKLKGKREKVEITPSMYRKIIAKYLRIWLYDFLWSPIIYYFPFGYDVRKYKTKEKYDKDKSTYKVHNKKVYKEFKARVGMFWERLGTKGKIRNLKLRKMTGSTNLFPIAEAEWNKYFSVHDLLTLEEHKENCKEKIKSKKNEQ